METCKTSIILAYLAAVYIIASIVYYIITRTYGTPFNDALSQYPELKSIKMKSVELRKRAFVIGLFSGACFLLLTQPFAKCN